MWAWGAVLLVPQKAATCGKRFPILLENFAEPSQYTESGPDFSRIVINVLLISLSACSQETRVHVPSTIFIGYLRRRSPPTSSRTEAPFEQCEPRLIGLFQIA